MTDKEQILAWMTQYSLGRKSFAEIFTPFELIEEMLDTLPDEVWSNPDLLWLDPCAGYGNFYACVIPRLMHGLESSIKDKKTRLKHILTRMLVAVEIQDFSVSLIQKLWPGMRVLKQSFLDPMPEKFDVILGNPPYEELLQAKRKAKNSNLWSKFTQVALDRLNTSGYLLFITPPAWMSVSSKLLPQFLARQLLVLNVGECSRHFNVGSKFSYYLIRNNPANNQTTHITYTFKGGSKIKAYSESNVQVQLAGLPFLPELLSPTSISLIRKMLKTTPTLVVLNDSHLHKYTKAALLQTTNAPTHPYKVHHTPQQTLWSSHPHPRQTSAKVMISLTSYFESLVVDDCGTTQGMSYIECNSLKDAEKLKEQLLLKPYRFFANITRWSNFNVPDVMKLLPAPPKQTKTSQDLYTYFGFNKAEIKLIDDLLA